MPEQGSRRKCLTMLPWPPSETASSKLFALWAGGILPPLSSPRSSLRLLWDPSGLAPVPPELPREWENMRHGGLACVEGQI